MTQSTSINLKECPRAEALRAELYLWMEKRFGSVHSIILTEEGIVVIHEATKEAA